MQVPWHAFDPSVCGSRLSMAKATTGMEKKMETTMVFRVWVGNEGMEKKIETTIGFRV